MRLGELLVSEQKITQAELEEALESQVVHGGRLGTNLLELGLVSEQDLAAALGRLHNVPHAAGEMEPDPKALTLVEPRFADDKDLIPMRVDATRLTVAALNPRDFAAMDALAFKTGKRVVPVAVCEFRLHRLLRRHFDAFRPLRALDVEGPKVRARGPGNVVDEQKAGDLMSEDEFQSLYAQALTGGKEVAEEVLLGDPAEVVAAQIAAVVAQVARTSPALANGGPRAMPRGATPAGGIAAARASEVAVSASAAVGSHAGGFTHSGGIPAVSGSDGATAGGPSSAVGSPGGAFTPAGGIPAARGADAAMPRGPGTQTGAFTPSGGTPAARVSDSPMARNPAAQAFTPAGGSPAARAPMSGHPAAPIPSGAPGGAASTGGPPGNAAGAGSAAGRGATRSSGIPAAGVPAGSAGPSSAPLPGAVPPGGGGGAPVAATRGSTWPGVPAAGAGSSAGVPATAAGLPSSMPPGGAARPTGARGTTAAGGIPAAGAAAQASRAAEAASSGASVGSASAIHVEGAAGDRIAHADSAVARANAGAVGRADEAAPAREVIAPTLPAPAERPLGGASPAAPRTSETVRSAAAEQASSAPPPPPATPLGFAAAQAELATSPDREHIARTVLRFAIGKFKRALLLSVQGQVMTGWQGMGQLRSAGVPRIGLSLRADNTFRLVRDTRSHYVGPMKRDAGTLVFYKLLAGGFPTTAVLLPLLARGKVVHILYVDNGPDQLTPPDIGELLILSHSVGRSYESLIQRRKKG